VNADNYIREIALVISFVVFLEVDLQKKHFVMDVVLLSPCCPSCSHLYSTICRLLYGLLPLYGTALCMGY